MRAVTVCRAATQQRSNAATQQRRPPQPVQAPAESRASATAARQRTAPQDVVRWQVASLPAQKYRVTIFSRATCRAACGGRATCALRGDCPACFYSQSFRITSSLRIAAWPAKELRRRCEQPAQGACGAVPLGALLHAAPVRGVPAISAAFWGNKPPANQTWPQERRRQSGRAPSPAVQSGQS